MKDKLVQRKEFDSEAIAVEAASWVLQLENGDLSDEDRAALREWAERSPAHARVLKEYASAWVSIDDMLIKANEAEKVVYKYSLWSLLSMLFGKFFIRLAAPVAVVFSIILYLTAGNYVDQPVPEAVTTSVTYSTKLGEQAQFKMADGSTAHLNTGSAIEVEYTPSRRVIHLLKGEVHFEVAHDTARPFDVIAHEKKITAVGTAFDVRLTKAGVNITVTEGVVVVTSVVSDPARADNINGLEREVLAVLEPNEKMVVDKEDVTVAKVAQDVIDRQLSWRDGILKFKDDSLFYVIQEVSRYTDVKIILIDPTLEDLRVGGLFKTGEIQALLSALELSFDLRARHVDENTIYLYRQTKPKEGI